MSAAGRVVVWLAGFIVVLVIILGIAGAAKEPYLTRHINGRTCTQQTEHSRLVC